VAANYDSALAQMRAAGLLVDHLDASGRIVRCKVDGDHERRGWYCLHVLRGSLGDDLVVGSFGVWQGNDNGAQKIELDRAAVSDEQRQALRARLRDDARKAKAERARAAERAARRAETVWRRCSHEAPPTADYLARKGVLGHGVRYTATGAVVVPMCDGAGRVHGLQFILSRQGHAARIKRIGRDKEYWPAGLQKQGRWFQIGAPSDLVLLCEGYATGATLHEATGYPVAVAFDAGNLAPVARELRRRYPTARVLVCADDDCATKGNPGIDAGGAAALAVGGAVASPVFTDPAQVDLRRRIADGVDWSTDDHRTRVGDILRELGVAKATDYNDLHAIEGLHTVRAQIEQRLAALGWTGQAAARHTTTGGEGRDPHDFLFDMEILLSDMTLIYGTDTVFDAARARIIGLGPLRSAAGKGLVRYWLEHPGRHTVLPEQVGFDPTETDNDIKCNLWSGWPTSPKAGRCDRLLDLLQVLCDGETDSQAVYDWLLHWLAYPIQHPGAKMQTSVLVHGPEGTGKNLFFGQIRKIYGRYGTQFSQVELESNFNGWLSSKLFAVGNEVVSRAELYHIQGRLKTLITEPEHQINEKMLPARLESNHCNFVFFSNRVDIAKLDPDDRHYCVIWTPPALSPDYYTSVAHEIAEGGTAALHDYLLHLDLGDFTPHSKPPTTKAKQDLIALGMDSTERFWREWTTDDLPLPMGPCRSEDLYTAYRTWCSREGIGKPAQKQSTVVVPAYMRPESGESERLWLGRHITDFAAAVQEYREGVNA